MACAKVGNSSTLKIANQFMVSLKSDYRWANAKKQNLKLKGRIVNY